MKKLIKRYLAKKGYRKLNIAELKTMNVGIVLTQEYINNRKLRRLLKDTEIGSFVKQTIHEWEKIQN